MTLDAAAQGHLLCVQQCADVRRVQVRVVALAELLEGPDVADLRTRGGSGGQSRAAGSESGPQQNATGEAKAEATKPYAARRVV